MVDARLPDGSRVNAIIPPLALDGPSLSIRRFGTGPLAANMDAATSSSQGTRWRKVVCGVLSSTTAPAVPPSKPASPMGQARCRLRPMSCRYAAMDVSWPGQMATVLVALACTGSIFMLSMAGNRRKDPPPATAFNTPARNAATVSQSQCQSMYAGKPERWNIRFLL